MREIRAWLEHARVGKGLTQAEVAKRLGITESYYAMIEAGRRQKDMRLLFAYRLSNALGIPVAKILDYETREKKE